MLCFEVHLNGEKLCTAGMGEFGCLSTILTWISHHPDKLAMWAAEGIESEPVSLGLTVSGLGSDDSAEHLKWVDSELVVGDEIRIRIIDVPEGDPPAERHREDPEKNARQKEEYVREAAHELGWTIADKPPD